MEMQIFSGVYREYRTGENVGKTAQTAELSDHLWLNCLEKSVSPGFHVMGLGFTPRA